MADKIYKSQKPQPILYNKMGLTSQIPKEIKIACREKRIYINKGNVKAKAVKSYADVTDKNYYLLEFLDALKDFNKIPDLDRKSAIEILNKRLIDFDDKKIKGLIKIGLLYPPRVRAFLGALLENIKEIQGVEKLQESLNPLSEYQIGISKSILPNIENWNIK